MTLADRLTRSCLLLAAPIALAACAPTPEQLENDVRALEPRALAAEQERAQADLNCGEVKTRVLSQDTSGMGNAYALDRIVYKIEATGCGLRTTYTSACTKQVCSALSDGASIQRVKP